MSRPAKIIIDLAAIQANCRLAQTLAPHSKTIAVVKADAYGHGAVEVAKALEAQIEMFAVSCLEEALVLRENALSKPILLLEGCFDKSELEIAADNQFELVVHNGLQLEQLLDTRFETPLNIWLKIDTGMHRLGVSLQQFESIYARLSASENVKNIVLMTHFAHADDVGGAYTLMQIGRLEKCMQPIVADASKKVQLSLANSAALLAWPQTRVEWNRPGIMLYGLSPFDEVIDQAKQLIPAMNFESQVIALRDISVGESVGYGCNWTAKRQSIIATIAVGYGDGYPRSAKSGTPVLINGHRAPLVGRVSMDLISVDVTDLQNVHIGDPAILWGKDLSANEVASWADSIGYELVTRMPKRAAITFLN
ncbi:alanine racemase [Paraglaciecola arctica]|uniref:Alanine racemase n=1 Tax=Paraglaciecola arctica BSs20135 TaxID=493475 RepID=K6XHM4_9ALTE|nr:alanine racemase [Paraglaciecola arctica]GAC20169.1 alanine racemase [Paraglaciecola arctica BSs20135]